MNDIDKIRQLVGNITEQDLVYVDSYVSEKIGIFIPSVGFCGYAIQQGHTHPAYSFVIFLTPDHDMIGLKNLPFAHDNEYVAAILPPDIPHEEKTGDEFVRYIALMISLSLIDMLCQTLHLVSIQGTLWHPFLVSKQLLTLIERFMEEYESPRRSVPILNALGLLIADDLVKSMAGTSSREPVARKGTIQSVIDHIQQHYSDALTVRELSGLIQVSPSSFSRQFKQETGKSPAAYLLEVRLSKAKKLLRSNELPITAVALNCGFSSSAHLATCFKKHFKMTPSQYRSLYINL